MFVRTKDGKIFDCYVSEQMGKTIYYPKRSKTNGYIDWDEVYKKSENIIGILELGDYVNGQVVTEIIPENRKVEPSTMIYTGTNYYVGLYNEHIDTIVTKEQFESMEYKLGDDK